MTDFPFFQRPRAPSFAARIVLLRILAQVCQKFDAWLEIYLKLIADRFKAVSHIFFVPHAFVQLDAMGLLVVVFLAMEAHVLLWLVVLVLLFFLFLARMKYIKSDGVTEALPSQLNKISILPTILHFQLKQFFSWHVCKSLAALHCTV